MLSYKILAPQIMDEEPNPKIATQKCLESTTLDPDFFRIGHTKASNEIFLSLYVMCIIHKNNDIFNIYPQPPSIYLFPPLFLTCFCLVTN